ncbi:regulatory protein RecX [Aliikangiella sp. G2MR2-5]|uniref:regulatory protein RecX n=1 Tax=Aliikangiella sp. G2MR2-5 TaxID=2788943 RepID=UPI0018AB5E7B|nr:regulatory protein RecX [Aliikangiella sp. G2MR2-5]
MNSPLADQSSSVLAKAIGYATRLLSSREYSVKQLNQKLKARGLDDEQVQSTLKYLILEGWQSDIRFCESFIRSKANNGQGIQRIRFELAQHGITEELLEKALNEVEVDWQTICDRLARKKNNQIKESDSFKRSSKLERFLLYRGFEREQIRRSINRLREVGESSGDNDQQ